MGRKVFYFTISVIALFGFIPINASATIKQIAAGTIHTVGLTTSGKVVAFGDNSEGQCDVDSWSDVSSIYAGSKNTYGVKLNGKVIATGDNSFGQNEVSQWDGIIQIAVGGSHTVGLRNDGNVVAIGDNSEGQCEVLPWSNITAIAAGVDHTVGLKNDGTVVAVGNNSFMQCDLDSWSSVEQIAANGAHTIGLRNDGTFLVKGFNPSGQTDVSSWANIEQITTGITHTVGLTTGGKVVAVGDNDYKQCDVNSWTNIVQVVVGSAHTIGLKNDGTIVGTGNNDLGQLGISSWNWYIDIFQNMDFQSQSSISIESHVSTLFSCIVSDFDGNFVYGLEYEYDFGDGTTVLLTDSGKMEYTYDDPGVYDVTCTVTDSNKSEVSSTIQVTVEDPSGVCDNDFQNAEKFPGPQYPDSSGICYIKNEGTDECGTGFLIAPDIILTNWHVFGENKPDSEKEANALISTVTFFKEYKYFNNGDVYEDDIQVTIGIDSVEDHGVEDNGYGYWLNDWAVIRLKEAAPSNCTVYSLSNVEIEENQQIYLIGHPGCKPKELACGVITDTQDLYSDYIFSSTINGISGSSGGPIFDDNGDVIGINVGVFTPPNSSQVSDSGRHIKISSIWDDIIDYASSTTSPTTEAIIVNSDLSFSIPNLLFNSVSYWADFVFHSENNGVLLWVLSEFGLSNQLATLSGIHRFQSNYVGEPVILNNELTFQLPKATYQGEEFWAIFKFYGEQNGQLLWYLDDAGTGDAPVPVTCSSEIEGTTNLCMSYTTTKDSNGITTYSCSAQIYAEGTLMAYLLAEKKDGTQILMTSSEGVIPKNTIKTLSKTWGPTAISYPYCVVKIKYGNPSGIMKCDTSNNCNVMDWD